MTHDHSEFRSVVRWTLKGFMDTAVQQEWIKEANVLLDALVLLKRDPHADIDAPITKEERLAVCPLK